MLLFARTLCRTVTRRKHATGLDRLVNLIDKNNISSRYEEALQKMSGRILFNSVLEVQKVRLNKFDRIAGRDVNRIELEQQIHNVAPLPLILNQLCDGALTKLEEPENEVSNERHVDIQDLPYSRYIKVEKDNRKTKQQQIPQNWLQDYELYNEADDELESIYGTPNSNVPVSNVPCGGCGALLHCKDTSIPGYIPSELFSGLSSLELKTIHCQRCHFLINYNTAINVTVKPDDYIDIVSSIKEKDSDALAIIMVDLLDFPCSIYPGLMEVLGPQRPIFIVGNKVDLIPRDSPNYLSHIKDCLVSETVNQGFSERNIKHVALISAKTGYGIESLITRLHMAWRYKGDVYLIGCTNVGKSSLFNALLRSDYCKSEASDLVQRATACPWPGTTLRMLKFPILRPSDHRVYLRTQRLISERGELYAQEKLRRDAAISTKKTEHATLIGHIGRTFEKEKVETRDPSSQSHESGYSGTIATLNEKSEKYANSRWCFDTPGVVQPDQILHLLTTDEIIKTLPKEMIRARAFSFKPEMSLFIAGLGRLDYIEGPDDLRVIVFASLQLPVSLCHTTDADEFYESFLGSELLGVPIYSGEERMTKWPNLETLHDEIVIEGEHMNVTACDILLSSAGWIGINLSKGTTGKFKAWTPEKRGIYVRKPSLLPHGILLKGQKVRHSLAYRIGQAFTYKKIQDKRRNKVEDSEL